MSTHCATTAPTRHPSGEARGALVAWPPQKTSATLVTAASGGSRRTGRAGEAQRFNRLSPSPHVGGVSDAEAALHSQPPRPLYAPSGSETPPTPQVAHGCRRRAVADDTATPTRATTSNSVAKNALRDRMPHATAWRLTPLVGGVSDAEAALHSQPPRPLHAASDPSHRRAGSRPRPPTKTVGGLGSLGSVVGRAVQRSEFRVQQISLSPSPSNLWPLASDLSFPPMPPRPRSPTTQMVETVETVETVVSVDSAKAGFGVRGSENPPPTTRPRPAPEGQQKQLAASAPSQKPALLHPRNT